MATLVSVNVGLPKDVAWNGRTVYTGVWKQPVRGPRMVRRLNVDGDGQGDLGQPGHFGENFTVEGLPDDAVCIGDRYRIGHAVFEVTQPRVTCYRVGLRLGEPQMATVDCTLEPLEPPAPGNILLCCARPAEPIVVDL